MQIPIPDMPPEKMARIQKEMDDVADAFKAWGEIDLPIAPAPIAGMAALFHQQCLGNMAKLIKEKREQEADTEPEVALINAISFGMYLGRLGYSEDSFEPLISLEMSEEDERRLLGGGAEGKGSGGTAPDGV